MNTFTAEEMNLVSIYNSADREETITEIIDALPVMDEDMRKIASAAITKLQAMTDDEYAATAFDLADENEDETL